MSSTITSSVVTGGTNSAQTVAEELNAYATDFVAQGVVGTIALGSGSTAGTGSFAVTQDASPDMGVTVLLGQAYVSGTPTGQDAQVLRARMTANYTSYTINANSSGSTKYDWIYLQLSATNANTPSTAKDNVITLYTSRSSSNASDNGSPPTYGLLLAVVTVVNGASSITNANIADKRVVSTIGNSSGASATGWNALNYALTYGANNGNKEFTVTNGNDLTGLLSPGMKLKISRSVTPPTQCMSFTAASSQYATKASPTGITFTSAFTCEAWVYLTSYPGGSAESGIISRSDASTGGFVLEVNASGQLRLYYGASSSFTDFISFQSIPLNRWVHVAGVCTSVSSKTAVLYINGVSVPQSSTLTSATSLTQTSNLSVGGIGAGVASRFFNGYISEARVWSVAQSQASIQANMAINLVGNETNLVALFQGNGNFNDATSNANNLTATNGAIATQANNPYNATEYAIVTKVSYSNPTTTVTLFTGTDYNIPNQTLNTPYYSTSRAPFGFPAGRDKWIIEVPMLTINLQQASPVNGTVYNIASFQISIPTGEWKLSTEANLQASSSSTIGYQIGLSTAANTFSENKTVRSIAYAAAAAFPEGPVCVSEWLNLSSQTTYYFNEKPIQSGMTSMTFNGDSSSSYMIAECAYI